MSIFFKILILLFRGKWRAARSVALKKYERILKKYFFSAKKHLGISVMNEDWDYLIILDACRYDYFENTYGDFLQGELQKKVTNGTSTSEWLDKNFTSYYEDTVYVSSNPHCSDYEIRGFKGTEHFFKVDHVWKYAWSEEFDTVVPKEVSKAALKLKKAHPEKRMIIHYIQPHGPWIGETKISVDEIGIDPDHPSAVDGKWTVDSQVWELVRQGRFDIKKLKRADVDNLKLVLADVKQLVEKLDGKVVITADHGEGFGEKFIFGHPPGIYTKELTEVPWLIIDKGKKDKSAAKSSASISEQDTNAPEIDEETLTKRLKALGYVD